MDKHDKSNFQTRLGGGGGRQLLDKTIGEGGKVVKRTSDRCPTNERKQCQRKWLKTPKLIRGFPNRTRLVLVGQA